MPECDLAQLNAALRPNERLLGLDLGEKTIGLALSDVLRSIATPAHTIRRTKFTADLAELRAFAEKNYVGALVIGLPLNMDGSEGPRVQSTRAFGRNIVKMWDIPFVFWDERLSTAAVTRMLIDADASRARRKELVDKAAAAYILQGFLDRLARESRTT